MPQGTFYFDKFQILAETVQISGESGRFYSHHIIQVDVMSSVAIVESFIYYLFTSLVCVFREVEETTSTSAWLIPGPNRQTCAATAPQVYSVAKT